MRDLPLQFIKKKLNGLRIFDTTQTKLLILSLIGMNRSIRTYVIFVNRLNVQLI